MYNDKCQFPRPGYSAVDMLGNCNVKVWEQTLQLLCTLRRSNAQANLQAAEPAVEAVAQMVKADKLLHDQQSMTFTQIFTRLATLIIGTACFVA